MGYTNGTHWTDDMVSEKIIECVSALNISRMPSREELRRYFGNDSLTNRIRRSGGYYGWAEKLGLQMKSSETQTGKIGEAEAVNLLNAHGFLAKRMPTRYPYDLYVDDAVKVDVKTSNPTIINGCKSWAFNLEKRNPTCDLYFLIARKENENAIYIVPSAINQLQICIGSGTKYETYRDRYDIVEAMVHVLKQYCEEFHGK